MAYPPRITVLWLPHGFHAIPMRGSRAVRSILIPAQEFAFCPAMAKVWLDNTKFAWRLAASLMGVTKAHASPRLTVRSLVTRQSSCTNGRYIFQRRPVMVPLNG